MNFNQIWGQFPILNFIDKYKIVWEKKKMKECKRGEQKKWLSKGERVKGNWYFNKTMKASIAWKLQICYKVGHCHFQNIIYTTSHSQFSRLIWTSQFVSQLWVENRLDSSMIRWIGWGLCSFLFRLLSMVLCVMLNMIEYLWQANQTRLCGWYVVLIFKECARK